VLFFLCVADTSPFIVSGCLHYPYTSSFFLEQWAILAGINCVRVAGTTVFCS